MKSLLFLAITAIFMSSATAQEGCNVPNPADSAKYIASGVWRLSIPELKEAAKESYFKLLDMINNKVPYTRGAFDTALSQYDYLRTAVDLKLSTKKERDEFYAWIVGEARAAGKLTYEAKKS